MSIKSFIFQSLIITYSCAVVACASSADSYESAGDPVAKRGHDCISQSSIRDYQVLDDRNLIVTAGAKRKYHVELMRRADGLRSNWRIAFKSPMGQVCSGSGDLVVRDGFNQLESIPLRSIRLLEPEELEDLLVRFGKKVPEEQETPTQEDIKGAEVEELG